MKANPKKLLIIFMLISVMGYSKSKICFSTGKGGVKCFTVKFSCAVLGKLGLNYVSCQDFVDAKIDAEIKFYQFGQEVDSIVSGFYYYRIITVDTVITKVMYRQ